MTSQFDLIYYLSEFQNARFKLYANLIGFKSHTELFNRLMPDTVLEEHHKLVVIELTCCTETNFAKSRRYKISCYENIKKTRRTVNGLSTKCLPKYSLQVNQRYK